MFFFLFVLFCFCFFKEQNQFFILHREASLSWDGDGPGQLQRWIRGLILLRSWLGPGASPCSPALCSQYTGHSDPFTHKSDHVSPLMASCSLRIKASGWILFNPFQPYFLFPSAPMFHTGGALSPSYCACFPPSMAPLCHCFFFWNAFFLELS